MDYFSLPIAVGALYVRRYFNEEARQAAIDVMEDIREAFIYILYKVPWMDEKTRMEAIKKAKLVVAHIGYPNELNDDNKLEEYYNGLEIESNNLLLNTLRVKIFQTDSSFKKLRETVNKTDWRTHSIPAEVNAFYIDSENSVRKNQIIISRHSVHINALTHRLTFVGAIKSVMIHAHRTELLIMSDFASVYSL